MAELVTIRCLTDNYAYLVHDRGCTVLIDAPEAGPILSAQPALAACGACPRLNRRVTST